jgi:hypothetical protein
VTEVNDLEIVFVRLFRELCGDAMSVAAVTERFEKAHNDELAARAVGKRRFSRYSFIGVKCCHAETLSAQPDGDSKLRPLQYAAGEHSKCLLNSFVFSA